MGAAVSNESRRHLVAARGAVLACALLAVSCAGLPEGVIRTPEARFENLPGYPFSPNYLQWDDFRIHYVDEGPRDGEPVLMLHGEPSWSYLYRRMIPIIADAGYRVIVPDLIGFGKSDKLLRRDDHSYQLHVDAMTAVVEQLDLRGVTLVVQDWGGLIGLRIAAENQERFARIVAANTALPGAPPGGSNRSLGGEFIGPAPPYGESPFQTEVQALRAQGRSTQTRELGAAFPDWQEYSQTVDELDAGFVVQQMTVRELDPEIVAAYDAPFPDARYKAGPRVMPAIVGTGGQANVEAWRVLDTWEKPFLTAFSDSDPILSGGYRVFQSRVPGTVGQPHTTIEGAAHFLQEDKGEELAQVVLDFIAATR
jgi:haloalkane dehalogenase